MTVLGTSYNVYMYFLILEQNTYTSNYASAEAGIIYISGTNFPIIKSEVMTNNGDAFDEKLT